MKMSICLEDAISTLPSTKPKLLLTKRVYRKKEQKHSHGILIRKENRNIQTLTEFVKLLDLLDFFRTVL